MGVITTPRQQRTYLKKLGRGLVRSHKLALGKAMGLARPELKATSPVDKGEYREKIKMTPVRSEPGRVWAEMKFPAKHSKWVWKFGYHEGKGRSPEATGLKRILDGVMPKYRALWPTLAAVAITRTKIE